MLESHPLARMIPEMTAAEYAALKADIAEHGQLVPIVVLDGLILDGRHRARACAELGLEPKATDFDDGDPADYVIATNLRRRHLTPGQLAVAAETLLSYESEKAKKKQREAGEKFGRGHPSEIGSPQREGTYHEPPHAKEAVAMAGARLGVSGKTVERVQRVKREDPELHDQIARGEMSATAAERNLRERHAPAPSAPADDDTEPGPVVLTGRALMRAEAHFRESLDRVHRLSGCAGYLAKQDVRELAQVAKHGEIREWAQMMREAKHDINLFSKCLQEELQ